MRPSLPGPITNRSDILICDWSAMAIEYALGLCKPVLFIDLPRRVRNPDWQALGIEPQEASFRELAGEVVSPENLGGVPDKIATLLDKRQIIGERMQHLRPKMVFNIGSSIEFGAREIARLADVKAVERQTILQEQYNVPYWMGATLEADDDQLFFSKILINFFLFVYHLKY